MTFQSSAETTPVERRTHPGGTEGAAVSLGEVAKKIREWRNNEHVQGWAGRVLIKAGKPSDITDQAQALLDALREQCMYVPDPVGTEMIKAPKHTLCLDNALCMPAGDCDDLSVALGAAYMSIGIPVKVVGQAFNGGSVPSHVLIAIETKWGWKKVDPSHKTYDVGDSFPASREWWIDPLDEKTLALSGSTLGDFVGVGQPPSYVFPVGVGELTSADKSAIYNTVTAQLQTALFTLEKSVNDLGASLQQVEYTRSILTPGRPYDSEPFSITSLADFPSNGIWTANMATVATQIWTVGDKLVRAGHEALNGVRKIFVDESTHEAYIAAAPSDEWSVHTILDSATQRIYGFFDAAKNLMSGISAKDGRTLTPDQVQKTISAPGASGTVQGTPLVGTGIAPAVIVIGAVVGVAIAGIAIYYSVSKWCDTSKDAAREATNKAIIDCVTSGQCSAQQGQSMLDAVSNNRRLESEADAQNRAADPFASTLASVGKIVMWTVIGGATIYGITLVAPLVRNAVIRHRVRRLTA